MNKKQILEYLRIIFDLEKKLYEVTKVRDAVDNQLFECEKPEYISIQSEPYKPIKYTYGKALKNIFGWFTENFTNGIWLICLFLFILGWVICFFTLGIDSQAEHPALSAIVFGLICSIGVPLSISAILIAPIMTLVNAIKYSIEFKEYKSVMECVSRNNNRIKAMNSQIANMNSVKKNRLTKELQKLKETRTEILKTLMQYYSLDIIYEDYREMPYIAMFIKYFESGRCNQFEGYEGAYNLLEQDIKYNNIMSRMDDILRCLENVKYSNTLLYKGIMECNNNISRFANIIINSANSIEQQISRGIDVTNERLASIEYSNYLIANNTQYLSDLKTFEMLLR